MELRLFSSPIFFFFNIPQSHGLNHFKRGFGASGAAFGKNAAQTGRWSCVCVKHSSNTTLKLRFCQTQLQNAASCSVFCSVWTIGHFLWYVYTLASSPACWAWSEAFLFLILLSIYRNLEFMHLSLKFMHFLIIKFFLSVMKINAFVGVLNFFSIFHYTCRFFDDWKMHTSYS